MRVSRCVWGQEEEAVSVWWWQRLYIQRIEQPVWMYHIWEYLHVTYIYLHKNESWSSNILHMHRTQSKKNIWTLNLFSSEWAKPQLAYILTSNNTSSLNVFTIIVMIKVWSIMLSRVYKQYFTNSFNRPLFVYMSVHM